MVKQQGDKMNIKLKQDDSIKEPEILITYAKMNEEVERVIKLLESLSTKIKCNHEGNEKFINISDVYYFESVDKMTFVYCERDVYKTELRLYQIAEDFAHLGFVQISKSCVLNINMLDYISPLLNSRMEATLKNSERLHITRKYLQNIKHALQGEL